MAGRRLASVCAMLALVSIGLGAGCAKRQGTTTQDGAAPAPSAKATPECTAISAYQLTQFVGLLPPEKLKEGIKAADAAAANLKAVVPELAPDVDAQMVEVHKLGTNKPPGSANPNIGKQIQKYWADNCQL